MKTTNSKSLRHTNPLLGKWHITEIQAYIEGKWQACDEILPAESVEWDFHADGTLIESAINKTAETNYIYYPESEELFINRSEYEYNDDRFENLTEIYAIKQIQPNEILLQCVQNINIWGDCDLLFKIKR